MANVCQISKVKILPSSTWYFIFYLFLESGKEKVGWLFGWGLRPFEAVFPSISDRLPERGRKKREMIGPKNPTRTYCKRSKPLPYCNPN